MSDGTLDDRYFEWLYKEIGAVRNRNPARSYWHLARQLYTTAFIWSVPNDDNRIEDGKELRYEFLGDQNIQNVEQGWMELECSFLEMLIALARRASFESVGAPDEWFWKFLDNMELRDYTDLKYNLSIERKVESTLERIMFRKYDRNGVGGIFPLRDPHEDQRHVELWYQLSAYLLEGDYLEHGPLV